MPLSSAILPCFSGRQFRPALSASHAGPRMRSGRWAVRPAVTACVLALSSLAGWAQEAPEPDAPEPDSMQAQKPAPERLPLADVFAARQAVLDLHVAPALERYLVELVLASRTPARYDKALADRIAWGASPRGSIALERCARARAWLAGRDYVTPDDVRAIAPDVLRHRVLPSYEATAEGWDGEKLVAELLRQVPLP